MITAPQGEQDPAYCLLGHLLGSGLKYSLGSGLKYSLINDGVTIQMIMIQSLAQVEMLKNNQEIL